MQSIIQLYIASLKEFMRERMSIFWTFAFPISFMVLFGIIFSGNGGNTHFNLGVVNQDQGATGKGLVQAFQSTSVFTVKTGTKAQLQSSLLSGKINMLVVIPPNISSATTDSKTAMITVYYDPTNQVISQAALPIVDQVVSQFNQTITHQSNLVAVVPKTVTTPDLREIDYLLPGVLSMSLMQLGLFATATVLVQLREQEVLRRLGATPLPRTHLLASQVLFRLTIGLLQAGSIILVGVALFNVHIIGNPLALLGIVLLGSLMFVALGYMISGLARSQDSVIAITNMINFPMMFLSGIFFPIALMPNWIRPVVDAMPLTYLADLLRQVMIKSVPTFSMSIDIGVLVGWMVVCSILAIRFFKWE